MSAGQTTGRKRRAFPSALLHHTQTNWKRTIVVHYIKQIETIKGSHVSPLSQEELEAKFRLCVGYSRRPFSAQQVDRIIDVCMNLENVKDIAELTAALTAPQVG